MYQGQVEEKTSLYVCTQGKSEAKVSTGFFMNAPPNSDEGQDNLLLEAREAANRRDEDPII
jgi:hypothetical protein